MATHRIKTEGARKPLSSFKSRKRSSQELFCLSLLSPTSTLCVRATKIGRQTPRKKTSTGQTGTLRSESQSRFLRSSTRGTSRTNSVLPMKITIRRVRRARTSFLKCLSTKCTTTTQVMAGASWSCHRFAVSRAEAPRAAGSNSSTKTMRRMARFCILRRSARESLQNRLAYFSLMIALLQKARKTTKGTLTWLLRNLNPVSLKIRIFQRRVRSSSPTAARHQPNTLSLKTRTTMTACKTKPVVIVTSQEKARSRNSSRSTKAALRTPL